MYVVGTEGGDLQCMSVELLEREITTHEIVAVVIVFLASYAYLHLIVAGISSRLEEVLGEKLLLLVKVVAGTLAFKVRSRCAH